MALEVAPAAPAPPPRFLRIWFCVSLALALAMLVGVSWYAKGYEELFQQMEMRYLPLPTEGLLALAGFVRTTAGVASIVLVALVLSVLAAKGVLDGALIKLIVINCIALTLLIPLTYLSLHLPIAQIQRKLEDN